MTALIPVPAPQPRARTIQDESYVDTTFTPHDQASYHVITWVARQSERPVRFFAIACVGAPLTGAFVPLSSELAFVDYVELFGVSQDMDLELLWAGWRALLYLAGRGDQAPPADLPTWRADWYRELSALCQASSAASTAQDRYVVSPRQSGPQTSTAAVESGGYPARREALNAAQLGAGGDMEALEERAS